MSPRKALGGYPNVVPYLRYEDPLVGTQWLTDVLGAKEVLRLETADGRIGHAEFVLGRSVISIGLALARSGDLAVAESRATIRQMTLVFVDDVDHAIDRGARCGGTLVDPSTDQPWGLRQAILAGSRGISVGDRVSSE